MLWMPQGLKMELAVPTSAIAHGHVHLQVSRLKVDSFNMLQSSKYVLNHLYRTSKKKLTLTVEHQLCTWRCSRCMSADVSKQLFKLCCGSRDHDGARLFACIQVAMRYPIFNQTKVRTLKVLASSPPGPLFSQKHLRCLGSRLVV